MARYDIPSPDWPERWNPSCQSIGGMVKSGLNLPMLPYAAPIARHHVRAVLSHWRLAQELIEKAELLACELVTNAARYSALQREVGLTGHPLPAGQPAPVIFLLLRCLPRHLVIEVSDPNLAPPVLAEADPEAEGGRGLILVDALSARWSYFHRTSGGKTVFCLIAYDSKYS